jgi:hypothetical protein
MLPGSFQKVIHGYGGGIRFLIRVLQKLKSDGEWAHTTLDCRMSGSGNCVMEDIFQALSYGRSRFFWCDTVKLSRNNEGWHICIG